MSDVTGFDGKFTYDISEPTARDRLRGILGDVDERRPLLADQLLDTLLTRYNGDPQVAAIESCERILAKLARDVDRNPPGFSTSRNQLTEHYEGLRDNLMRKANATARPVVTGLSKSEERSVKRETDFRFPPFEIGQDDNPRVASSIRGDPCD